VVERIAEVQRRVQAAVSYPPIARKRGVHGEALVSFLIAANGNPHAVQTLQSSGSGLLDRAALAAVERAAPLPWIYGRVAVPVRFTLRSPD
jgi:protein TonB